MSNTPLISVRSLQVEFASPGDRFQRRGAEKVRAVNNISFDIYNGETFGLVGESGCGKSTSARAILGLIPIKSGKVLFEGQDISTLKGKPLLRYRRNAQVVFQDPYASLDPRQRILDAVVEPMSAHGVTKQESMKQASDMLEYVGIRPEQFGLFPHQFSGGQRQRICIARSLVLSPKLLILDEPTSALDVSIQAQILILLKNLQRKFGLTYLFISHNLSVVRMMSNRVASMFKGKIVEAGGREQMFLHSSHPYTQRLISSIPEPIPDSGSDPVPASLKPSSPTNSTPVTGCVYQYACPYAFETCVSKEPMPQLIEPSHVVSCHLYPDRINDEIRQSMKRVLMQKGSVVNPENGKSGNSKNVSVSY